MPARVDLGRMTLAEVEAFVSRLDVPPPHRTRPEDIRCLEELALALVRDRRVGVRRLGERLRRAVEVRRRERLRAAGMLEAEAVLCPSEVVVVAGMDEAGRGPLAGPVVAAAVVLRPGAVIPGLDDSKNLPEKRREELYGEVLRACRSVGVGVAGPRTVDRMNVLEATYVAMRRAVARLGERPDFLLVDGFRVPGLDLPQRGVVGGDGLCASIAAASVVAKVTRDRIMRQVAKRFPGYGFERNKGYSTPEHREGLRRLGPCPAHRLSFIGRGEAGDDLGGLGVRTPGG
ncbi:MAG TPA: ribonuclease HII [Clostridiales bacterium]|nr:ribonuclease HII [Clostridiales bacterium]